MRALIVQEGDWFARDPERERWAAAIAGASRADEVIRGFDFEWSIFRAVRTPELGQLFEDYFDLLGAASFDPALTVIDAGCGAGRWAAEVSSRGPRVIAIDLGASVDVARANTDPEWVACIQADVRALPLRDASADWAYSLGVLHHTDDPAAGLAEIARCVRPGGRVLLYLYYALEQRGLLYRALFRLVDRLRRITSHLPRRIVVAFAALMAILAYWPLARLARLLAAIGREDLARSMPLGFYRTLPLRIMFNDSLDRFGTTLERRFTRSAMQRLMERSGLSDVAFSERPPHWRAVGRRD